MRCHAQVCTTSVCYAKAISPGYDVPSNLTSATEVGCVQHLTLLQICPACFALRTAVLALRDRSFSGAAGAWYAHGQRFDPNKTKVSMQIQIKIIRTITITILMIYIYIYIHVLKGFIHSVEASILLRLQIMCGRK